LNGGEMRVILNTYKCSERLFFVIGPSKNKTGVDIHLFFFIRDNRREKLAKLQAIVPPIEIMRSGKTS
jgi:hypothetical protein